MNLNLSDIFSESSFINYWNQGYLSNQNVDEYIHGPTTVTNPPKKKYSFLVFKYKKKGMQVPDNPNKKIHSRKSSDLIKTKIQRDYLSYLINLANDAVRCILLDKSNNLKFLQIDGKIKILPHKLSELRDLKYKDIFSLTVSKKNKGIIEINQTNERTYLFIIDKSSLLKEFFDQSYLDIFEKYYYKNIRNINFKGEKIILSEKTQTFSNLLIKGLNGNDEDRFEFIINNVYINNNHELELD